MSTGATRWGAEATVTGAASSRRSVGASSPRTLVALAVAALGAVAGCSTSFDFDRTPAKGGPGGDSAAPPDGAADSATDDPKGRPLPVDGGGITPADAHAGVTVLGR